LDSLQLLEIDAPNGVDTVQGESFVWLDNQFAEITIHPDGNRQALRQAIWRKAEASWQVCGIPEVLYTDNVSDFTSQHLEQTTDWTKLLSKQHAKA
jgi:hypothetical protein